MSQNLLKQNLGTARSFLKTWQALTIKYVVDFEVSFLIIPWDFTNSLNDQMNQKPTTTMLHPSVNWLIFNDFLGDKFSFTTTTTNKQRHTVPSNIFGFSFLKINLVNFSPSYWCSLSSTSSWLFWKRLINEQQMDMRGWKLSSMLAISGNDWIICLNSHIHIQLLKF